MVVEDLERNKTSMTLGIISLIVWIIPFIGYPVSIAGLVFSILEIKATGTKKAYNALILNIIGLILTIISSIIGLYINSKISNNNILSILS